MVTGIAGDLGPIMRNYIPLLGKVYIHTAGQSNTGLKVNPPVATPA